MNRNGVEMHYLSIANEPDWPHTQPSYFLDPDQHAALFAKVADYLTEMAKRHPEVPRPKLVGPNGLSVIDGAERYLPPLLRKAGNPARYCGHPRLRPPGRPLENPDQSRQRPPGLGHRVVCEWSGRFPGADPVGHGVLAGDE
jgi:hypothetical protein